MENQNISSKHEIERIAVRIGHLDDLLSLTGEVIINSSNLSVLHKGVQDIFDAGQSIDKDSLDMLKISTLTANRISSDLHALVMDVRLVEIRETFQKFRRLIRDIGKREGKKINFRISGEDTQVDKAIVEKLYDPLNHLMRNAADHGIESPIERKKAGKPAESEVFLNAYSKEKFTIIEVADDGRGIDPVLIIERGIKLGLIQQEEAARLTEKEALALIFLPGLTTSKKATDISGRGVGMDVVKNDIESLGGTVDIETEKGRGTKFVLRIPQLSAVNITDGLTLRAHNSYYAIPIESVVATLGINRAEITRAFSKETILYLGNIVTLHGLTGLLNRRDGAEKEEEGDVIPVIIIEAKNGKIGLKVSEFLAPQKLVILPLAREYFNLQGVSGMTIMGGKRVGMIIEPHDLIALATSKKESSHELRIKQIQEEDAAPAPEEEEKAQTQEEAPFEKEEAGEQAGINIKESEEFFVEIDSLIKDLDEGIFHLEKTPDDEDMVNKIFRYFHSLKGDMVMVGCSGTIIEFVHNVETILDRVRSKEISVTEDIIDVFLDSAQVIKNSAALIKSGKMPVIDDNDLLARMEPLMGSSQEARVISNEDIQQRGFELSPMEEFTLLNKRIKGDNIYHSYIEFSSNFQENFLVAFLILKRLTEVGNVISSIPQLGEIDKISGNSIKVLFSSQAGMEEVNRFMDERLKEDYDVEEYHNYLEG